MVVGTEEYCCVLISNLSRAGEVWGWGGTNAQVGNGALAISKRTVSFFVFAHVF